MNHIAKHMKTIFSAAMLLVSAALYGQAAPAAPAQKGFTIDTNTLLIIESVLLLSDFYRTHWPFMRDRRIDSYQPITKRFIDEEK